MRIFAIFAVVFAAMVQMQSQSDQTVLSPQEEQTIRQLREGHYQLLREDEDWSFLRDPNLRGEDFWDPIKYIPLRSGRPDWYVTIGGEARYMWEQVGNNNWGQAPYWNTFFNQRYMPYFDLHYGKHVRTFIELKSGLNSYEYPGPRPIDEKKLDFQAGFLEIGTSGDQTAIQVRAGRLELEYGSGRLIDVREGPNVRLSFTGFQVKNKIKSWEVDGIAVRPDVDNFGFFDNVPNHAVSFWGVYATRPLSRKLLLDTYYLGIDQKQVTYERGTAQQTRNSVGGRISRPIATERPGWDFDDEGLFQFGTFGSANIRAFAVSTETGYRIPTVPLQPRLSLKADITSGDNPNTNTLGTFDALFPKGNYFGVIADQGPGPDNFTGVHPKIEMSLPHNVSAFVDCIFWWRESLEDGVYAVNNSLIRAADGSRARYVGTRPGTEIRWQVNRHAWFQADYGIFYAGPFLRQTQPGRNLNYWVLWAGYEF